MIRIICGLPGDGKSLFSMHLLIRELRENPAVHVMTNMAVRMGELNHYCQIKYPMENIDPLNRVHILTDEQAKVFWEHRPTPRKPYMFDPKTYDEIQSNDPASLVSPPCTYFLEEAHEFWNARDWSGFAREAMHYLSQHRKFGDNVYAITQSPGNLDKQFRSLTAAYMRVRNDSQRNITMWFFKLRGNSVFTVRCYYRDPMQGTSEQPFDQSKFRLDAKGIAACYDTAKGVGVFGSKADIGKKAKGIPLKWVWPIAFGTVACIAMIPFIMAKSAQHFITSAKNPVVTYAKTQIPQAKEASAETTPDGTGLPYPAMSRNDGSGGSPVHPFNRMADSPSMLGIKTEAIAGNQVRVTLTDGSLLTESSIRRIYSDRVECVNGTIYYDAPTKWPEPRPALPVEEPLKTSMTKDVAEVTTHPYTELGTKPPPIPPNTILNPPNDINKPKVGGVIDRTHPY